MNILKRTNRFYYTRPDGYPRATGREKDRLDAKYLKNSKNV